MAKLQQNKTGLFKLGYVRNISEHLKKLRELLEGTCVEPTNNDVNQWVEDATVEYLNKYGYSQDSDGTAISEASAMYKRFKIAYKTSTGKDIYGWFNSVKSGRFEGITWGTLKDFKRELQAKNMFRIGDFCFEEWSDGLKFLEDIAVNTIPESWKYKNKPSTINHPILKSYLENIFERLKKETEDGESNKIIYSKDGKYVMFNTNLLDKFFHEILVIAEVKVLEDEKSYLNPFRARSISDRVRLNFDKESIPTQPKFFENVNDVIFQTSWVIDKDFDTFTHIIEERQDRFPDEYKGLNTDSLARKLDDAIDFAVAIAQRNYKFIVPMYRPQTNMIQLLMPIYLNGAYSKRPDFALILTPDDEHEMYIPETILPLDAVYQNARLIAKPDESWLNPDTIL